MRLIILLAGLILVSCSTQNVDEVKLNLHITKAMEYAYFEGQLDAINGDIRIDSEQVSDTYKYKWIKSPWDQGKEPTYIPGAPLN